MNKYYEDHRISQSHLKRFLNPNPRSLYRGVDEEEIFFVREKVHFSKGKLLDVLLEGKDPTEYFYIESPNHKRPTEIIESICHQAQTENDDIASFEQVNQIRIQHNYQPRWKDEKKIRAWYESLIPILQMKKDSKDLTIITHEEYEQSCNMANAILQGQYTKPILDEYKGIYQADLYTSEFKCLIDYLQLDHKKKVARVIDFKTTSDYLENFQKSIKKFRYDIQLSFYSHIVQKVYPKYKILNPILIAVSTKEPEYAEPFELSEKIVQQAKEGFYDKYNNYYKGWLELYELAKTYNQELYNRDLIKNGINIIDEL